MFRICLLFSVLFGGALYGQQVDLLGKVSVHNSRYTTGEIQYVKDTYISAPFTKPASTDNEGNFNLSFVGLDPGTSIQLTAEKDGMEVVNQYDLRDVVIGRKFALRIFVIEKGKLAEAQTELYNISKKALFKRKDAMIARLRKGEAESKLAMAELEEYFGHPVTDILQAEKELIGKISELEKRLPEFAQNLAKQNLDFASDMYIEAYELYKEGEIEAAIKVLDTARLNASYVKAQSDVIAGEKLKNVASDLIEKGKEQIQQVADSYELKAKSHYLLFQYEQATEVYEKLVEIYLDNDLSKKKLLPVYDDLALVYQDNEKLDQSMVYHKKLVALGEEILDPKSLELAQYYNNIALNHSMLDESELAFPYQLKAIAIQEEMGDSLDLGLSTSYNNIGMMYQYEDELPKALEYLQKAIYIQSEVHGPEGIEVALYYSNISAIYRDFGDYDNVIKFQQKALEIREKNLDANHPDLAISYQSFSEIYQEFGEFDKALELMIKATRIRESTFRPDHPIILDTYLALSRAYNDAEDYQQAIEYQEKAIDLINKIYPDDSTQLIDSYYTLGIINHGLKDYKKSLDYHFQSLELKKELYDPDSSFMANSYYRISQVYNDMADYPRALEFLDKAVKIDEKNYGKSHHYVAEDYLLYAEVQLKSGNISKSKSYRNKASRIIEKLKLEFKDDLQPRLEKLDAEIASFGNNK